MNQIQKFADTSIISDSNGVPVLTMGHILAGAVACVGFYFMIPERKRRQLFK